MKNFKIEIALSNDCQNQETGNWLLKTLNKTYHLPMWVCRTEVETIEDLIFILR